MQARTERLIRQYIRLRLTPAVILLALFAAAFLQIIGLAVLGTLVHFLRAHGY